MVDSMSEWGHYHYWMDQITALLRRKRSMDVLGEVAFCEYVDIYDFVFLKKDEALGLITIYVELKLIGHTKDNECAKEVWDTFKIVFGMVNTAQVNQLEA
jgi:hypothetical protein